jgi:hypothetical protein
VAIDELPDICCRGFVVPLPPPLSDFRARSCSFRLCCQHGSGNISRTLSCVLYVRGKPIIPRVLIEPMRTSIANSNRSFPPADSRHTRVDCTDLDLPRSRPYTSSGRTTPPHDDDMLTDVVSPGGSEKARPGWLEPVRDAKCWRERDSLLLDSRHFGLGSFYLSLMKCEVEDSVKEGEERHTMHNVRNGVSSLLTMLGLATALIKGGVISRLVYIALNRGMGISRIGRRRE